MANPEVTGIILAGGKSSRMQTDKGFVSYKGKLLIEHALDQLTPVCNEIIISANRNEYKQFGYRVVKDKIYDLGPLGGIYSAVEESSNDLNLIIACDVFGIKPSLLSEMVNASSGKHLVCLQDMHKKIEPLPLLLKKDILNEIGLQIEKEDYKLQNFIHAILHYNTIGVKCLPLRDQLLNLNTLEDLKS